nr:MAG TPA: hypothetical protein [Caudoviricetes sp.]
MVQYEDLNPVNLYNINLALLYLQKINNSISMLEF